MKNRHGRVAFSETLKIRALIGVLWLLSAAAAHAQMGYGTSGGGSGSLGTVSCAGDLSGTFPNCAVSFGTTTLPVVAQNLLSSIGAVSGPQGTDIAIGSGAGLNPTPGNNGNFAAGNNALH